MIDVEIVKNTVGRIEYIPLNKSIETLNEKVSNHAEDLEVKSLRVFGLKLFENN